MYESGVMDIQSHAVTHTFFPKSNKVIDFRHPGDLYYWMTWNQNTGLKPKLFYDDLSLVHLGEPVFEHGPSLSTKRFIPDTNISLSLSKYVLENGGANFFKYSDWKSKLTKYYKLKLAGSK